MQPHTPSPDEPSVDSWRSIAANPQLVALYFLLAVLLLGLVLQRDLPGEYWPILAGVASGSVQAARKPKAEESSDLATP